VVASREAILAALEARSEATTERPRWSGPSVSFDDPVAAFREMLEAAGGSLVCVPDAAALEVALAEVAPEMVLHGGPAVAESGAVWWVPSDTEMRRSAFLAERVALIVPRAELVDDLHRAYRRIDPAAQAFGVFVSGPSKTADIEQALVIGAHGPRVLTVLLVG
jgi:L-lactate dehydrogenase complex protein LldG